MGEDEGCVFEFDALVKVVFIFHLGDTSSTKEVIPFIFRLGATSDICRKAKRTRLPQP